MHVSIEQFKEGSSFEFYYKEEFYKQQSALWFRLMRGKQKDWERESV